MNLIIEASEANKSLRFDDVPIIQKNVTMELKAITEAEYKPEACTITYVGDGYLEHHVRYVYL